jgi:hypothetical protein
MQQMRNLGGRTASHKAVINKIAFICPSVYLIFNKLFGKYCRMLERDLILGGRSAYIIGKNVAYFPF